MRKNIRRSLVALAAAGACLAASAIPAGATAFTADITGGNVLLAKTGQTTRTIPLGGTGGGAGCSSDIDVDITATTGTTTGTANVTGLSSVGRTQPFGAGTSWYVAEITRTNSTAGVANDVTDSISGVGLSVNAKLWLATDQTDTGTSCAHGTSTTTDLKANWNTTIPNIGGAYSGNVSAPAVSDTATLTSTASTPLIGTSSTPFAAYSLGNVTLSSVVVHLISSP